jgi:uncharacterized protein (DUF488 family)
MSTLYTIGHSSHPIDHLISLLRMHAIQRLVDVRSVPASRFHPQYNQNRLADSLAEAGIEYFYLGDLLGGRPSDPSCYPGGKPLRKGGQPPPRPDFNLVMQKDWFQDGIERLVELTAGQSSVILCSEEDPDRCHRKVLIAEYLAGTYPEIETVHIRKDGRLE